MAVNPGYHPQHGAPVRRQSRNDVLAALLLIIAGAAGVLQFFLEWQSVEGLGATGQDIYEAADVSGETLAGISVLAVLIGGGLLVLLGVALLIPTRSRKPSGSLSLIVSLVMLAAAVYFLVESDASFDGTTIGYYLFLGAGAVGLVGSLKAVAS